MNDDTTSGIKRCPKCHGAGFVHVKADNHRTAYVAELVIDDIEQRERDSAPIEGKASAA
jgi:hypothetical protein